MFFLRNNYEGVHTSVTDKFDGINFISHVFSAGYKESKNTQKVRLLLISIKIKKTTLRIEFEFLNLF